MSMKAVTVTLNQRNLLWLQTQAADGQDLSKALNEVLTKARTARSSAPIPSVKGMIEISPDDPDLSRADEAIRALFTESISRPID